MSILYTHTHTHTHTYTHTHTHTHTHRFERQRKKLRVIRVVVKVVRDLLVDLLQTQSSGFDYQQDAPPSRSAGT